MDLTKAAAVIRPRDYWASVDLGIQFVKAWWLNIYASWILVTLPVFVVLNVVFRKDQWIAWLIFWWLLPFFERIPLQVMSRRLFNGECTYIELVRMLPSLLKRQWLSQLLWRRISLIRSLDMPVLQLERLTGESYRRRIGILQKETYHIALLWTLFNIFVQLTLVYGLLTLVWLFAPTEWMVDWRVLVFGDQLLAGLITGGVVYIVLTLVAPFYVSGGFALYLNRRIIVEGWDIELAFKNLIARIEEKNSRLKALSTVGVLVISTGFSALYAESVEAAVESVDRKQSRDVIDHIYGELPFKHTAERLNPTFDPFWSDWLTDEDESESDEQSFGDVDWRELAEMSERIGGVVKIVLIGFLVVGLYWVIMHASLAQVWRNLIRKKQIVEDSVVQTPPALLDVSQGVVVPYDLQSIDKMWQVGNQRQAMSNLYQWLIARLRRQGMLIHPSHTEADIALSLKITVQELSEAHELMKRFLLIWCEFAYGNRVITGGVWQQFIQASERLDMTGEKSAVDNGGRG